MGSVGEAGHGAFAPAVGAAPTLRLLGGFELRSAGKDLPLPQSAQRLIALLALEGQPVHRASVAGRLWPDTREERSTASLRSTLWRIRRCAPGVPVVEGAAHALRLAPELLVDVAEMTALAGRLISGRDIAVPVDPSCDSLRGVLLPGWYEDWVLIERERLQQLQIHALEALARRWGAAGRYGEAVQAALSAVQQEPLRESAHRVLIGIYLAEGNHVDALRQYRLYERLAADELGVAPSAAMRELLSGDRPGVTPP